MADNANAAAMQLSNFVSAAAVAMLFWDWIIQVIDEVEYIWRGKLNMTKLLYFISRYGLIFAQLAGQVLNSYMNRGLLNEEGCFRLFVYKAIVGHMALTLVELVLLIKVYTNQTRRTKMILTSFFCVTAGLEITGIAFIIDKVAQSSVKCVPPTNSRMGLILFALGGILFQCFTFFMTIGQVVTSSQHGSSRTPLTTLMLRDGVATFLVVSVLLIGGGGYEIGRTVDLWLPHAAWSCYVTVLSITACRMVMNMKKFANARRFAARSGENYKI